MIGAGRQARRPVPLGLEVDSFDEEVGGEDQVFIGLGTIDGGVIADT